MARSTRRRPRGRSNASHRSSARAGPRPSAAGARAARAAPARRRGRQRGPLSLALGWLRGRPRRGGRARHVGAWRGWPWLAALVAVVGFLGAPWGCATPPRRPGDLCAVFEEKRDWYRAAAGTHERWGVPEPVQLAIIFQESSFRARARPPRRRLLGFLPGPRPSTAYGYGQATDATWGRYRRDVGRPGADRDDFADVSDFIGWYADEVQQRTGVPRDDAFRLYLAYHEGPGGYRRGTWRDKAWLQRVARRVASRAGRYEHQLAGCRERLERSGWWPF